MKFITPALLLAFALPAFAQEEDVAVPEGDRVQLVEADASLELARQTLVSVGNFLGLTATSTRARIAAAGADVGIAAAAQLCSGQFGKGARMCTAQELYQSVQNGRLGPTPQAWVFTPPTGGRSVGGEFSGLDTTCGGFTYDTADKTWTGTSMSFAPVEGVNVQPRFSGRTVCSTRLPIACCRN